MPYPAHSIAGFAAKSAGILGRICQIPGMVPNYLVLHYEPVCDTSPNTCTKVRQFRPTLAKSVSPWGQAAIDTPIYPDKVATGRGFHIWRQEIGASIERRIASERPPAG